MEMDAKQMSLALLGAAPTYAASILVAAYLAAGVVTGVLFFRGLWWNARLLVSGGSVATSMFLLIGRFALLGGFLTLAALHGAGPLLGGSLGVFIGRFFVLRAIREDET
jgi:F1F0 ATPase subunit 2